MNESLQSPTRMSDDDIEIELSDVDHPHAIQERPPVQAWLGMPGDATTARCYLYAPAVQELLRHALPVTDREVGGVLVGTVHHDPDEFILLVGAIPAQHALESRANLTFTQASWQSILAEQERRYPGTVIVGWYHTHPGYGLFLSEHDQYIHRNFFNLPFQVAIVVDPLAGSMAMLREVDHQIRKDPGMPVYGGTIDAPHLLVPGALAPEQALFAEDEVEPATSAETMHENLAELQAIAGEALDCAKSHLDHLAQRIEEQIAAHGRARGRHIDREG